MTTRDQFFGSEVFAAGESNRSAKGILDVGARLRAGVYQRYADYQQRRVAAAMYAVLARLNDEELASRGIARADLARYCGSKSFSSDV